MGGGGLKSCDERKHEAEEGKKNFGGQDLNFKRKKFVRRNEAQ